MPDNCIVNRNEQIAIIVPVYNKAQYLSKCIESILNQTYHNIEVILVNDASTDDSKIICQKYHEKDNRVVLINHDINQGVSFSRKTGVDNCRSGWITFVDADDYLQPEFISELLKHRQDNTDIIMEIGKLTYFGERIINSKDFFDCEYKNHKGAGQNGVVLWGKIYRAELIKSVLEDCKLYSKDIQQCFFEDFFCLPRIYLKANQISLVKAANYKYTVDTSSISHVQVLTPYKVDQIMAWYYRTIFIKSINDDILYTRQVIDSMLNNQMIYKIPYSIEQSDLWEQLESKLDYVITCFQREVKQVKPESIKRFIVKLEIIFFCRNRRAWKRFLGNILF